MQALVKADKKSKKSHLDTRKREARGKRLLSEVLEVSDEQEGSTSETDEN